MTATHTRPPHSLPEPTIKVCGLTNAEDALQALDAGANVLGFVVAPESPRGITTAAVAIIKTILPTEVPTVLVTTHGDPLKLHAMAEEAGVSHVQLCGEAQAQDFQDFAFPLLRRIGVEEKAQHEMTQWAEHVEAFVLDHPSAPGGTGQMVNLDLAAELAANHPCLLAGGLSGSNVIRTVKKVRPLGVDASSRLEHVPGEKDPDEVRHFAVNARMALRSLS